MAFLFMRMLCPFPGKENDEQQAHDKDQKTYNGHADVQPFRLGILFLLHSINKPRNPEEKAADHSAQLCNHIVSFLSLCLSLIHILDEICGKLGIEYSYTPDYPSDKNLELCRGCECVTIITSITDKPMLDKLYALGVRYLATRSIGYEHIDVDYAHSLGMKVSNVGRCV